MMRYILRIILLMVLILMFPFFISAKESLMVKDLKAMKVDKVTAAALSEIIKSTLSGYYDVQSMDALAAINNLVEEKLNAGCDDTKCIMEVAGALNIEREQRGKSITNSIGQKFVYIEPGTFMMGSPSNESGRDNDETQHQVKLTKGFYMQTTEVTQGQWNAVMGNNTSHFKNCGDNCPVEKVSWEDCQEFIRKLNAKEGTSKYRLPTEAEWEYACRAGTTGAYAGNLDNMGWYRGNAGGKTHPVAQKEPNAWGLYDMHGNVWEWCQDWYGSYPSSFVTDPEGPSASSYRVSRGGGWSNYARFCRSADRNRYSPDSRLDSIGFRLTRTELNFFAQSVY